MFLQYHSGFFRSLNSGPGGRRFESGQLNQNSSGGEAMGLLKSEQSLIRYRISRGAVTRNVVKPPIDSCGITRSDGFPRFRPKHPGYCDHVGVEIIDGHNLFFILTRIDGQTTQIGSFDLKTEESVSYLLS